MTVLLKATKKHSVNKFIIMVGVQKKTCIIVSFISRFECKSYDAKDKAFKSPRHSTVTGGMELGIVRG